jgi:hypothetical protein
MRNFGLKVLIILCVYAAMTVTAMAAQVEDEIELTRDVIKTERKAIIANNMQFTEEESQAFWPVYNDYQEEMREVGDRKVKLIMDFAKDYETLTAGQANAMLEELLSIKKVDLKVKKKYVTKLKKVLPAKKIMRFYQLENKLDAIINYQLAAEIPLVR